MSPSLLLSLSCIHCCVFVFYAHACLSICQNSSSLLVQSRKSRSKPCLATEAEAIQTYFNGVGDEDASVITWRTKPILSCKIHTAICDAKLQHPQPFSFIIFTVILNSIWLGCFLVIRACIISISLLSVRPNISVSALHEISVKIWSEGENSNGPQSKYLS